MSSVVTAASAQRSGSAAWQPPPMRATLPSRGTAAQHPAVFLQGKPAAAVPGSRAGGTAVVLPQQAAVSTFMSRSVTSPAEGTVPVQVAPTLLARDPRAGFKATALAASNGGRNSLGGREYSSRGLLPATTRPDPKVSGGALHGTFANAEPPGQSEGQRKEIEEDPRSEVKELRETSQGWQVKLTDALSEVSAVKSEPKSLQSDASTQQGEHSPQGSTDSPSESSRQQSTSPGKPAPAVPGSRAGGTAAVLPQQAAVSTFMSRAVSSPAEGTVPVQVAPTLLARDPRAGFKATALAASSGGRNSLGGRVLTGRGIQPVTTHLDPKVSGSALRGTFANAAPPGQSEGQPKEIEEDPRSEVKELRKTSQGWQVKLTDALNDVSAVKSLQSDACTTDALNEVYAVKSLQSDASTQQGEHSLQGSTDSPSESSRQQSTSLHKLCAASEQKAGWVPDEIQIQCAVEVQTGASEAPMDLEESPERRSASPQKSGWVPDETQILQAPEVQTEASEAPMDPEESPECRSASPQKSGWVPDETPIQRAVEVQTGASEAPLGLKESPERRSVSPQKSGWVPDEPPIQRAVEVQMGASGTPMDLEESPERCSASPPKSVWVPDQIGIECMVETEAESPEEPAGLKLSPSADLPPRLSASQPRARRPRSVLAVVLAGVVATLAYRARCGGFPIKVPPGPAFSQSCLELSPTSHRTLPKPKPPHRRGGHAALK